MTPAEIQTYEYSLGDKFFMDIDGTEVHRGKVNVTLRVERKATAFELRFHINGAVYVSCDRCLDYMEQPVETNSRLIVKLGKEYAEESDEILVISEEEGALNVAWFLYEFVALAVPMKHIHPPGKCNRAMTSKLRKHTARRSDEEDDYGYVDGEPATDEEEETSSIDPRWEVLKELM